MILYKRWPSLSLPYTAVSPEPRSWLYQVLALSCRFFPRYAFFSKVLSNALVSRILHFGLDAILFSKHSYASARVLLAKPGRMP